MNQQPGEISRCYSLTYTRRSKHSPERLWHAITDSGEASCWMGHPARIEPRVGGAYSVDFSRTGGLDIDGVIVALEPDRLAGAPTVRVAPGRRPEKLLRYAWGTSVVEWAIDRDGAGSRFILTLAGLEPGRVPEDAFAAGWHCQLADLERYLSMGAPSSDEDARELWNLLRPQYQPGAAAVLERSR